MKETCSCNDPCIPVSVNNCRSLSCGETRSWRAGRRLWSRGNCRGHLHTKVTYEARFQKVHEVVCALRSFSRSWKHLQTEPCTDCILEYASLTQAIQSSGSSFGSSCSSFCSHLQIWHHCCEAAVPFTVITHHQKKIILFMTIVTYIAPMGVGSFVKPQVC